MDRDQVAARAVERVVEAARFADQAPALRIEALHAVVGVGLQPAEVEHLALREVGGEKREMFADPLGRLFHRKDLVMVDHRLVEDDAQAGFALQRDHPEPQAFLAEMVGGEPAREMAGQLAARVQPALLVREAGELLEIDLAFDPPEEGAVFDRAFAGQLLAFGEETTAAGGIDHPARRDLIGLVAHPPGDPVASARPFRLLAFGQLDLEIGDREVEVVALGHQQVAAQQLAFEGVAVELVAGHVRHHADVGLAEILEVFVGAALGLPVEAQVVFDQLLAVHVFLELEHPRVVVAGDLHRRLAVFLASGGDFVPLLEVDHRFLACSSRWRVKRQAGETAPSTRTPTSGSFLRSGVWLMVLLAFAGFRQRGEYLRTLRVPGVRFFGGAGAAGAGDLAGHVDGRHDHRGDAAAGPRPVADVPEVVERPAIARPALAKLVGRHLPAEHGALGVPGEPPGGAGAGRAAHHDPLAGSRQDRFEMAEQRRFDRRLVGRPIDDRALVELQHLLEDQDLAAGRRHGRLVEGGREDLAAQAGGAHQVGIPVVPVITLDRLELGGGHALEAEVGEEAGKVGRSSAAWRASSGGTAAAGGSWPRVRRRSPPQTTAPAATW